MAWKKVFERGIIIIIPYFFHNKNIFSKKREAEINMARFASHFHCLLLCYILGCVRGGDKSIMAFGCMA